MVDIALKAWFTFEYYIFKARLSSKKWLIYLAWFDGSVPPP